MKQIDYEKLDPKCVDLVKYFNENGLRTFMCCQGHPEREYPENLSMSMFWIEFHWSVSERAIGRFMKKHGTVYPDGLVAFWCNGAFVKRLEFKGMGSYRYMAANPEAAADDLRRWKEDDAKRMKNE